MEQGRGITIGTIGHADDGKTTLTAALTDMEVKSFDIADLEPDASLKAALIKQGFKLGDVIKVVDNGAYLAKIKLNEGGISPIHAGQESYKISAPEIDNKYWESKILDEEMWDGIDNGPGRTKFVSPTHHTKKLKKRRAAKKARRKNR
tara:strand:- start:2033 stop:2476 length:444 start_codon:yes stop_codon:yes gene_type:complete